ncbi:uncharacterized protein LOC126838238 [Adelges cooleyi]|uniref:uncharacterized protein LOC126838238 n=1 Tax=Adelges cooleyi TaxID=133065 RepID=UPI00217FE010|nr:uncharacterized protein LOC126838238 [Adelges cooleyi]
MIYIVLGVDGKPKPVTPIISTNKTEVNSPLIIVSNRLPFVLTRNSEGDLKRKHSAGGLVTAVTPVVIDCNGTWIGWTGLYDLNPNTPIPESDPSDKSPIAGLKSSQIVPVEMKKEEFEEFYNGCCNSLFWPLFHSMPDRAEFVVKDWIAYCRVNEKFANCVLDTLRQIIKKLDDAGDEDTVPLVWIHDYQLLTAGKMIREVCRSENLRVKLGFFLHIPFPSWDIMRLLPWGKEVFEGLLAYDVVGFHINDYCLNFIDCCSRQPDCQVDRTNMMLFFDGRIVDVRYVPIGIPFNDFVNLSKNAKNPLLDIPEDVKVILGVDRLDYTKGIIQRILAYEKFLVRYPEFLGKVVLVQVSVPSRTEIKSYQMLKEETEQIIRRINDHFSTDDWSPIRYIYGCLSQEDLAALYRDCRVALVTPLRDGMNLVAKEFVACQTGDPGVLVLSPFAGAAEQMTEALIANPYEMEEMVNALHTALEMPLEERQSRMTELRHREQLLNVNYWMRSFISFLKPKEEPKKKFFTRRATNRTSRKKQNVPLMLAK